MLPEDLMLLFLDEKPGRVLMDSSSVENALAGAVLLELVNARRVSFEANGKKLVVADPLSRLNKPVVPRRAVEKLRRHMRDNVMAQLEGRGVLTVEKTKMLGIFPTKSYVIQDHRALIALLYAVKGLHKVFKGDKREMNARAKDISAGNWAGNAVKKAMEAAQAAVMAGMAASTAAATSGGGSS